jgi:hypothetical protein
MKCIFFEKKQKKYLQRQIKETNFASSKRDKDNKSGFETQKASIAQLIEQLTCNQ